MKREINIRVKRVKRVVLCVCVCTHVCQKSKEISKGLEMDRSIDGEKREGERKIVWKRLW